MGKKIVKICVLLIFIAIFAFVGIVSVVVYDTVRTHTSQIELSWYVKISPQGEFSYANSKMIEIYRELQKNGTLHKVMNNKEDFER